MGFFKKSAKYLFVLETPYIQDNLPQKERDRVEWNVEVLVDSFICMISFRYFFRKIDQLFWHQIDILKKCVCL